MSGSNAIDFSYLADLPAEQLAKFPAGIPPPGVTPNYINPPTIANEFYIVGPIAMVFMFLFVGLRYYVKLKVWRKTTPDDWTTLVAVIFTTVYFPIAVYAMAVGKYGTHAWDLKLDHVLSNKMLLSGYVSNWTCIIPRAFAKASFFLMYIHLFRPFRWLRWVCYVGLVINVLFYLSITIARLAYEVPPPGSDFQHHFLSPIAHKAIYTAIPGTAGGLAIDVLILIIPMLAVRKLQLTFKKKIGLCLVFATGIVACIASAMSVYYAAQLVNDTKDFSFWSARNYLMVLIESCAGIACSCMPACAHLFKSNKNKLAGNNSWLKSFFTTLKSTFSISSASATGTSSSSSSPSSHGQSSVSVEKAAGRRHSAWLGGAKKSANSTTSDLESTNDSKDDIWDSKMHGVRTTVCAVEDSPATPDLEQGKIYVERTFHTVAREHDLKERDTHC